MRPLLIGDHLQRNRRYQNAAYSLFTLSAESQAPEDTYSESALLLSLAPFQSKYPLHPAPSDLGAAGLS